MAWVYCYVRSGKLEPACREVFPIIGTPWRSARGIFFFRGSSRGGGGGGGEPV